MDSAEDYDNGNEVDFEPEPARDVDFMYEIKSLVISLNSLDMI